MSDQMTFVIVHDQQLLLEAERQGRFASLSRSRYLFVGLGPTDLIDDRDDVVVARRLPGQYRGAPEVAQFYRLVRDRPQPARTDSIRGAPGVRRRSLGRLRARDTAGVVGQPCDRRVCSGTLDEPALPPQHNMVHGVPCQYLRARSAELAREHLSNGGTDLWTASTNHALRADDLVAFVQWFTPVTPQFRHDLVASAVHERSMWVFCRLNSIEDAYVPDVLHHTQAESHGVSIPYAEVQRRANASPPLLTPADTHAR